VNLYEVLGIGKNADPAGVKRAYRKRAQKAHPDRGGSAEDFVAVNRAYEILSDPVRRLAYDNGEPDVATHADAQRQQMLHEIAALILGVLEQSPHPENIDVLGLSRQTVSAVMKQLGDQVAAAAAGARKLRGALKRFKTKGESDIIKAVIEGRIAEYERNSEKLKQSIARSEEMLKVLGEYAYEWEAARQERVTLGMLESFIQGQNSASQFGGHP
jgi:curved DNA-binding protein CbpA